MKAANAGVVSALLASACCIGPLLFVVIGLGSSATLVGRYHWFFLIGGLGVLAWAWAKYLREKTVCDCEHKPMEGSKAGLFTLLAATAIVLGFVGLNISRLVLPARTETQRLVVGQKTDLPPGLQRAVIPVAGMTCVTCEIAVRAALNRVKGVRSAQVSVATLSATVEFDPMETKPEQLVSVVNSTGYRASLPKQ